MNTLPHGWWILPSVFIAAMFCTFVLLWSVYDYITSFLLLFAM